jgi:hypothetical protein
VKKIKTNSLLIFIKKVRTFLEPHWVKAHEEWQDIPVPCPPSKYMCRYSCLFLKKVLKDNHYGEWQIVLGRPSIETEGTAEGKYGYKSPVGSWHDHAWLIQGDLLLDITADQFQGNAIYLGDKNHSKYNPNITLEAYALLDIQDLQKRVNHWLNIWDKQNGKKA